MPWMAFGISLAISLPLIPLVRNLSLRLGRVERPREDRWSKKPTATLGGIGIFLAFLTGLAISAIVNPGGDEIPWGILVGSSIVFLLGAYDDWKPITPQAKLVGQILAAAVVISFGYQTKFFTPKIPNSIVAQLPNILLTFVWLVGITNAINLLDNMDGLAGGISLITALFLSFFFWQRGDQGLFLTAVCLAGSLLGFLVFNFPPASIFMGDSGSLTLGFTLAALAIARQARASNVFAVMGVPTLLFLLPILDTALVTFTRILRGQSPAQGGRDHTSHRLIAFGLNERQAVLVLYGIAVLSGLAGLAVESLDYWLSLLFVPMIVLSFALLTAYLGRLKVMIAARPADTGKPFTRIMLELTYKRRLLEVFLDFFLIGIAYYLAFLTVSGFRMTNANFQLFLQSLPVALAGTFVSFFLLGIYKGVWRYVGVEELVRYAEASASGILLVAVALWLLYSPETYSLVTFLFFAVFLFLGLAASRFSFRILDKLSIQQTRPKEERVLIYGAGDEGEMALRWIQMNPELDYQPVGFLDNDPYMIGRNIHGVEVLGSLEQLESILKNNQIDGMIITSNSLVDGVLGVEAVALCRGYGCWVRSLRLEFELLE